MARTGRETWREDCEVARTGRETWRELTAKRATTPGEGLGEAREGLRRLLLEEVWGSPRRVAATTSGESLGEARRGRRRLLWETSLES